MLLIKRICAFERFDDVCGGLQLFSEELIVKFAEHWVRKTGIGNVALSLFLVLALMTLRLWELAGLAGPMVVILVVQVALIAAVCVWPMFAAMGKDYDSAVMSGGLCGFMLGTTANAMANMKALTDRFGPAPRAFLVVPMVGAFFIDFVNAVLITFCLNIWG